MKCKFCGKEIEAGKVYCDFCGKPVQMVPDYSPLEEDLLPQFVSDENKKDKLSESDDNENTVFSEDVSTNPNSKKEYELIQKSSVFFKRVFTKKRIVIFIFIIVAVAVILLTYFSPKNQIKYGDNAYSKKDYGGALTYYLVASNLDNSSDLLAKIGNTYYYLKDYENSKRYFERTLEKDSTNYEAFCGLVNIAIEDEDYDAIFDLAKYITTKEQKAYYKKYDVAKVIFSEDGGNYNDDIELSLSNKDGYDMYYTLDGTTPDKTNGTLYTEPINITDGDTVVTVRCANKYGYFGKVYSNEYVITYTTPDMPVVTPDAGNYNVPTQITITCAEKNVSIYYAWDETEPSINSLLYTGPIDLPEGSHILSAVAINKNGLSSAIYRGNFVYEPGVIFPDASTEIPADNENSVITSQDANENAQ